MTGAGDDTGRGARAAARGLRTCPLFPARRFGDAIEAGEPRSLADVVRDGGQTVEGQVLRQAHKARAAQAVSSSSGRY